MNRFARICLIWTLLAGFISAQRLPDSEIPPPPPSGLSDDNDVLGKNSDAQARVIGALKALENDHGYRMYVVLERSLLSSNASDLASQLQQAWVPDGDGLVIVFESDTRRLGFGRGLEPEVGTIPGDVGVPAFSLVAIISGSLETIEIENAPEVYIENLVTDICSGLTEYFEKKAKPQNRGRSLRLALVTIGALSLLALCGMGVGWLMGKADKKQSEARVFPEVDQPERLGASYGGGGGSSHYFGIGEKK